jgi:competence ComEA-like helix-hairpin-helix protein
MISDRSVQRKSKMGATWAVVLLFLIGTLYTSSVVLALTGQLNINSATAEELELLPFTGKQRARSIVIYRQKNGPFETLDEMLQIPEIGPRTFEAIKPYLKLSGPSTLDKEITAPPDPAKESAFKIFPSISTQPGQVMLLPDRQYYETLTSFIQNADRQIDLAMFLFKMTDSPQNRPAALVKELIAAKKRGVNVRVVLEKSGYDENINKNNREVAQKLATNRIKVQFDSKDTTSHMKLVVVDNRFCFIGSHNLTHAALTYNHEFTILIDSHVLAQELNQYIDAIPEN